MLWIINGYVLLGLLFGIYFVLAGCRKLDPSANTAGFVVRLMWLPAAVLLWPILLRKILSGDNQKNQMPDSHEVQQ